MNYRYLYIFALSMLSARCSAFPVIANVIFSGSRGSIPSGGNEMAKGLVFVTLSSISYTGTCASDIVVFYYSSDNHFGLFQTLFIVVR